MWAGDAPLLPPFPPSSPPGKGSYAAAKKHRAVGNTRPPPAPHPAPPDRTLRAVRRPLSVALSCSGKHVCVCACVFSGKKVNLSISFSVSLTTQEKSWLVAVDHRGNTSLEGWKPHHRLCSPCAESGSVASVNTHTHAHTLPLPLTYTHPFP